MHPTEPRVYSVAELRAWMDSQESSSEFDFVEAHVDSCKLCADVVDSLMRGLPVTEPHPLEIQSQARVKRIIGPGFDVEQRLGKGGSGEVWKCREHSLGRQVAIKFLNTGMLATGAELRRLRREAESLGRTDHPHVCRLYHVIERVEDNVLCLVMEYLGGGTLRDYLAQHQNISIREIVGVFTRLAEGVEHLHSLGLIHRDIKPANVLFSQNGVPKLTDLGLIRAADQHSTTTGPCGTLNYAAPEQLDHDPVTQASINGQVDVYGLGATLYEALTGQVPFPGEKKAEVEAQVYDLTLRPASPRRLNKLIDDPLARVCLKAIAKRREERYATVREFAEDLRKWLNGKPVSAQHAPWWRIAQERMWRHPVLTAVASLIFLCMLSTCALVVIEPFCPLAVDDLSVKEVATSTVKSFHSPAISPDGKMVLAVSATRNSGPGEHERLALFRLKDGVHWVEATTELPNCHAIAALKDGPQLYPAWSPDNSRFAFYAPKSTHGRGIYVAASPGSDATNTHSAEPRLVGHVACGIDYTFSLKWADSKSLLVTDYRPGTSNGDDGKKSLRLIYVDEPLTSANSWISTLPAESGIQRGAISPDGKSIAFTGPEVDFTSKVFAGRIDLEKQATDIVITSKSAIISNQSENPCWIDNRTLCFPSADKGRYRVSVATSSPFRGWVGSSEWKEFTLEIPTTRNIQQVSVSPETGTVAFAELDLGDRLYELKLDHSSAAPTASFGDLTKLIPSVDVRDDRRQWEPEWNEQHSVLLFAFDGNLPGQDQIYGWTGEPDSQRFPITTGGYRRFTNRLSPDGTRLIVNHSKGANDHGGEHLEIAAIKPSMLRPNGSSITDTDFRLFIEDSRSLVDGTFEAAWSLRGDKVCFSAAFKDSDKWFKGDVLIGFVEVSADQMTHTLDQVKWLRSNKMAMEERPVFSPDGKWILCEGAHSCSGWNIYLVDPQFAKTRPQLEAGEKILPEAFRQITNDCGALDCGNERSPRWLRTADGQDYVYYVKDYRAIWRQKLTEEFLNDKTDKVKLPPPECVLDCAGKVLTHDCFCLRKDRLYVSVRDPGSAIKAVTLHRRF